MPYVNDLVQSVKSRGVAGTSRWIAAGFLRVNQFLVFHIDLRAPRAGVAASPSLELREGTVAELERLRAGRSDLPVEFYCDRTHGFTTPFFATWNGELAAVEWIVHPGQYSRFVTTQPGEVELNFVAVLPQFRGHRIAQALMTFIADSMQAADHHGMFCVVHAANIAQFKPMIDVGFRPVESLFHFAQWRPKATLRYLKQRGAGAPSQPFREAHPPTPRFASRPELTPRGASGP